MWRYCIFCGGVFYFEPPCIFRTSMCKRRNSLSVCNSIHSTFGGRVVCPSSDTRLLGSAPHPHRPSSTISGSASGRVCTGELTANQFTCINPPMKRCAYLFYYLLLSTACSSWRANVEEPRKLQSLLSIYVHILFSCLIRITTHVLTKSECLNFTRNNNIPRNICKYMNSLKLLFQTIVCPCSLRSTSEYK